MVPPFFRRNRKATTSGMILFNRPAMPYRRGGFLNSHLGGKEQNGQQLISEDFTFLAGSPKLFPVSHRSQVQSCRPATTSSQMLQSFFAFTICLLRRYGLSLKIPACERCETLHFLPLSIALILRNYPLAGLLALLFCFVYVAQRSGYLPYGAYAEYG